MKRILALLMFVATISVSGAALADQILTEKILKNFLASMDDVKVLAEEMDEEGKNQILNENTVLTGDGELAPYLNSSRKLKEKYPNDYQKLGNAVSKHGFSSVETWAMTGDDVMSAFMTVKMDPKMIENLESINTMPPEVVSMMPAEAKEGVKRGKAILQAIKEVPAENAELVKAHTADIEASLEKMKN